MNIIYIFRRPVEKLKKEIKKKSQPSDTVYGMTEVLKKYTVTTSDSYFFKSRLFNLLQIPITIVAAKITGLGFSLLPIIAILDRIKEANLIFTTVDTVGLPVLALKYFNVINKPVIYNTIGLDNCLRTTKNRIIRYFYSKLLDQADFIISVASFDECKRLASYLNLPLKKFIFCPFGIDSQYFSPSSIKEENFILSVGADPQRDWQILLSSAENFRLPLKIICQIGALKNYKIPKNVEVVENLPIGVVREYMSRAKIIVLTLKQSSYFTGQTTLFRAMSMGKPVVITETRPFQDYPDIINGVNCSLCKPGDRNTLIKMVNFLIISNKARRFLGKNARKLILEKYTVENYAENLMKIFDIVLKTS